MEKTYYVNGQVLTFDIIEESEAKIPVWYAKCRENGKTAWLDNHGIQFEGERRFAASPEQVRKCYITYEHNPLYPEDFMPITLFHDTLEEAECYAKRVENKCGGDIFVDIYEAERRN